MIKVGITGQAGFIGYHLFQTLGLFTDNFERITFHREFFNDINKLSKFIDSCDVVVHLAALIRHEDSIALKNNNIELVDKLINAYALSNSNPKLFFASSTQENSSSPYGLSKKEISNKLKNWSNKNNIYSRALIIPNVYGPFCKPFHNSVVATFCSQLVNGEEPIIKDDNDLDLIFVNDLAINILDCIKQEFNHQSKMPFFSKIKVKHSNSIKVSKVLSKLRYFKKLYFTNGIIPSLDNSFDRNLFNTFLCYINFKSFFPFKLKNNIDNRGSFVETVKFHSKGQVSFSSTVPGIVRGNHFHTRKAERFIVISGKAKIEIRRLGTNKKESFILDGSTPSFVDMPIWHTHNITNIGKSDLYTLFWTNEYYDSNDPDTYFKEV